MCMSVTQTYTYSRYLHKNIISRDRNIIESTLQSVKGALFQLSLQPGLLRHPLKTWLLISVGASSSIALDASADRNYTSQNVKCLPCFNMVKDFMHYVST